MRLSRQGLRPKRRREPDPVVEAGYVRGTLDGRAYYRGGDGPAVIVLHELPGLDRAAIRVGGRIRAAGFSVYLPVLVGPVRRRATDLDTVANTVRICVSREFAAIIGGRRSRVSDWVVRLARQAHAAEGGPGVGVVGMCLSGGFALAAAIDPAVRVAVVSQPGLPLATFPFGRWPGQAADLGLSAADRTALAGRTDLCVRGYRYSEDGISPEPRMTALEQLAGPDVHVLRIEGPGHPVLSDAAAVPWPVRATPALEDAIGALMANLLGGDAAASDSPAGS
jgi:dienelactone hydrolase